MSILGVAVPWTDDLALRIACGFMTLDYAAEITGLTRTEVSDLWVTSPYYGSVPPLCGPECKPYREEAEITWGRKLCAEPAPLAPGEPVAKIVTYPSPVPTSMVSSNPVIGYAPPPTHEEGEGLLCGISRWVSGHSLISLAGIVAGYLLLSLNRKGRV